jgi:2-polyprenyl-3-methyl-5-hydroxy-6-metoxy-1,4-benzoquinol methylase
MQISSTSYHGSKHLTEEELHAAATSCPWCNCRTTQTVASLQQNPLVTLEECRTCFALSASRMPTDKALANYYNAYYRDERFEKAGTKVTVGDVRRMGLHLSQWMDGRARNGIFRILDFGGGDGSVAVKAAEILLGRQPSLKRIDITVTDYNPVPVASPSQAINLQHCSDLKSLPFGEFDFVIASAILEHIPESKATLHRLLDLMRPGAGFYARTPFVAPMLKLCRILGIEMDFTFPGHLYDFGQAFWEKQFASPDRKNVFRVIASRPSIVETTFQNSFLRTIAAHACKLPWFLLGSNWGLVGGWEVVVERIGD